MHVFAVPWNVDSGTLQMFFLMKACETSTIILTVHNFKVKSHSDPDLLEMMLLDSNAADGAMQNIYCHEESSNGLFPTTF